MTLHRVLFVLTLLAIVPSAPAHAQWGNLTGRFVYDGDAPVASPIVVTKDQAVCGKHDLVNERLMVNPDNNGIAGIMVYVYVGRGKKGPKPHPSYAETAEADVHLDNLNCRYEPHIALLRTGQTLVIGNKDSVGHNTMVKAMKNVPINPIIPANGELKQKFPKEERLPVKISCSIHPWMNAILVVRDSPYMAVSDENGNFTIENLPEGKWSFQVYHDKVGYVGYKAAAVKIDGKKTQWKKGVVEQTIASGDNDLGEILVPPIAFKK